MMRRNRPNGIVPDFVDDLGRGEHHCCGPAWAWHADIYRKMYQGARERARGIFQPSVRGTRPSSSNQAQGLVEPHPERRTPAQRVRTYQAALIARLAATDTHLLGFLAYFSRVSPSYRFNSSQFFSLVGTLHPKRGRSSRSNAGGDERVVCEGVLRYYTGLRTLDSTATSSCLLRLIRSSYLTGPPSAVAFLPERSSPGPHPAHCRSGRRGVLPSYGRASAGSYPPGGHGGWLAPSTC